MQARSVAMKGANPPATSARGAKCRQSPILPGVVEQIGGRADLQAKQHIFLFTPGRAAAKAHADREIGDKADAHARICDFLLRGGERAVRDPLQEGVEKNLPLVRRGKIANAGLEGSRHSGDQVCQFQSRASARNRAACSASNRACAASAGPWLARNWVKSFPKAVRGSTKNHGREIPRRVGETPPSSGELLAAN